jgi:hypothetical protein
MLIAMVETELEKRRAGGKYSAHFRGQSHFFGYNIIPFSKLTNTLLISCFVMLQI